MARCFLFYRAGYVWGGIGFEGKCAPAPGYRSGAHGTLYNVGQNGYNWSSVLATGEYVHRALYLYFGTGGSSPQSAGNRANGLQVRCLQE